MIELIVTISANGVVGIRGPNKLLWDTDVTDKFFRKNTLGSVVVMGNNTWKVLGKPLINRTNIVLAHHRRGERNGVEFFDSIESIMTKFSSFFVIGGGEIFNAFLPFVDEIRLATISIDVGGDQDYIYFPTEIIDEDFFLVKESSIISDIEKTSELKCSIIFSHWKRDITNLH